jgi:hypothetical protein
MIHAAQACRVDGACEEVERARVERETRPSLHREHADTGKEGRRQNYPIG